MNLQEWDLLTKQFQDGNERASQEFENVKYVLSTMNSGLGYAKELCSNYVKYVLSTMNSWELGYAKELC
jgi:hypothetical protein